MYRSEVRTIDFAKLTNESCFLGLVFAIIVSNVKNRGMDFGKDTSRSNPAALLFMSK